MTEKKKSIKQLIENETHFLDFDLRYQISENIYKTLKHGSKDYPVDFYLLNATERLLDIIPWHWHKETELIYILDGCGEFRISEDSFQIHEGEALFINSQVMHSFCIAPGSETCTCIDIVFRPDYLIAPSQPSLYTKYIYPIMQNQNLRGFVLTKNDIEKAGLTYYIPALFDLNIKEEAGYELHTRELLTKIWLYILKQTKDIHFQTSNSQHSRISLDERRTKEALQYIENHYTEPITLDDIANSIHLSRSECCRCIKRCMNMTPFEFLLQLRIQKAGQLLSNSKSPLSIAELASAVGFNSCSYFNKLFRKYMGCTPSQYKKRMRDQ